MSDCRDCNHLEWLEADSADGWPDEKAGFSCGARHGVDNLKQFPFTNTKCSQFQPEKDHE